MQRIAMEDHFVPGLKPRPAVHVGSQSMPLFRSDPKEQAWETLHLAAAYGGDIAVVRDVDPAYLDYWTGLMGPTRIMNLPAPLSGQYLSEAILDSEHTIGRIRDAMDPASVLAVFFPTRLEQELADRLGIPLHGSPAISDAYGTKSGIRALAREHGIPMPPGHVCSSFGQVCDALHTLRERFGTVAIKHDLSTGGCWSTIWDTGRVEGLEARLDEVAGGRFVEGRDTVVVEGWLASKAALCAHIDIVAGSEPLVCAAWEQIIDADGTSYIGARPLAQSPRALESLLTEVNTLAGALHRRGAVGSFAPDFLVVAEDEPRAVPDTCVLLELNARVPATAFPLEIVKRVRGTIGDAFCARHVKLARPASFRDIAEVLRSADLLITECDASARGVVPYNVGLLQWQLFDVVIMADCWEETRRIDETLSRVFGKRSIEALN